MARRLVGYTPDDGGTEIIICRGPPDCNFKGTAAVENQKAGCPLCKRVIVRPDGSEIETARKPN